jgi:predicted phosphodiesterase
VRIAVLTDAHANLPALEAALDAIRKEGCDVTYHTGDAISIGPYPAECLDLLLSTSNLHLTMGNHDAWFVHGLPQPQPSWMSDGEVGHHHWVYAQLDPDLRDVVAGWPWTIEGIFEGVRVTFAHYAPLGTSGVLGNGFAPIVHRPTAAEQDRLFAQYTADVICYGHTHVAWDVSGRARYVNPGSLGCCAEALARFVILDCRKGSYALRKCAVPYDDGPLYEAFERRQVPERQFLYQAFFGSRFPPV